MVHPIVICSKGRPSGPSFELLRASNLFPIIFVEPDEHRDYTGANPGSQVIRLALSGQGITYSRNAALSFARESGWPWFWMLDDDLTAAFLAQDGKCLKTPLAQVLMAAQGAFKMVPELAQGGLEYQQFAWRATKPLVLDSYCDVAVCINTVRTAGLVYRDNRKEDRDFTLQCLTSGFHTARAIQCAFAVPSNGSNKGGLHEDYASGKESAWTQTMVDAWPGICEARTKPNGRPDTKIHWKRARPGLATKS